MGPDVVVHVQRCARYGRLVLDRLLDDKHLRDVGDLEQMPVVERLLALDDVREIDELGSIRRAADLEHAAARVEHLELERVQPLPLALDQVAEAKLAVLPVSH